MQKEFLDQLGDTIQVDFPPKRIISLVPSQTELLYDLNLTEEVVGITKFCVHPTEWFQSKCRVGGTKTIDLDKVKQLKPDLIIGNKEENEQSNIEELRSIAPVWMSDIYNLTDSLTMIRQIGELTDRSQEAHRIQTTINKGFKQLTPFGTGKRVLYLIWKNPYMGVAQNTFIHALLENELGFSNVLSEYSRYPELNLKEIDTPDLVFLSSEPYPFKEKHVEELQAYFPSAQVILVDGEYFSWYGSRLIKAPAYFEALKNCLKN